jgi:urate oxidase
MTTNERLLDSGLLDRFQEAEANHDAATVREILQSVFVDEPSIQRTIRQMNQAIDGN